MLDPSVAWPQQSRALRRRYPEMAGEIPSSVFFDPFWNSTFMAVSPPTGGIAPFALTPQQCVLAAEYMEAQRRNLWIVHVKPRKEGSSTLFASQLAWLLMFKARIEAAIIGFTSDPKGDAMKLSRMTMTFQKELAKLYPDLIPRQNARTSAYLNLDNDSRATVLGAGDKDPGRGGTSQYLLGTEISTWNTAKAQDTWAAILNSVGDSAFVVAESTPRFPGDPLHRIWMESQTKDSRWHPVFLAWHRIASYSLPAPPHWEPEGKILTYAEKHPDVSTNHLYWMHRTGLAKSSGSLEVFSVEYPYSAEDCWQIRGNDIFDRQVVSQRFMELTNGSWDPKTSPAETWFKKLARNTHYILTIDPADEFAERDSFGIEMFDCLEREQVYEAQQHFTVDQILDWLFGKEVDRVRRGGVVDNVEQLGSRVRILIEANNIGSSLISAIRRMGLGSYLVHCPRDGRMAPGFYSHKSSKAQAIVATQHMISDRSMVIHSPRLLFHMQAYPGLDQPRARDVNGGHYDLVIALIMVGWYIERRTSDFLKGVQAEASDPEQEDVTLGGPPLLSYIRSGTLPTGTKRTRFGIHR